MATSDLSNLVTMTTKAMCCISVRVVVDIYFIQLYVMIDCQELVRNL